jgi:site-specific recombinase XerD
MTECLPDLAELLPSWVLALQSERKTPGTVKNYHQRVSLFLRWCADTGTPPVLTKPTVQAYTTALLKDGMEGSSARARQLAVKRFAAWLTEEGELDSNPLLGLKPPKIDTKVTNALTDDQLSALVKACAGKRFIDRRDEALVRLMAETGLRASEVIALQLEDVDVYRGLAVVQRGKGGKGRVVPFSAQTGTALDRYLRMRRSHRAHDDAHTGPLWIGGGNVKTFGYHALDKTLKRRAVVAGIKGFHLHLLRHTAATRWLRAGGSEGGLMTMAGWTTREMLDRYTSASASERMADEARGLGLGDM